MKLSALVGHILFYAQADVRLIRLYQKIVAHKICRPRSAVSIGYNLAFGIANPPS